MAEGISELCGVGFPITMEGRPMAVCLRRPKHRGDHSCRVLYKWPQDNILKDGSRLLTGTFRAPKEAAKYIEFALAREQEANQEASDKTVDCPPQETAKG